MPNSIQLWRLLLSAGQPEKLATWGASGKTRVNLHALKFAWSPAVPPEVLGSTLVIGSGGDKTERNKYQPDGSPLM